MTRVKDLGKRHQRVLWSRLHRRSLVPAGNGNLMNILDNGIHLAQTMSFDQLDTCLDLITFNGAKTLNIEDQYGIEAG